MGMITRGHLTAVVRLGSLGTGLVLVAFMLQGNPVSSAGVDRATLVMPGVDPCQAIMKGIDQGSPVDQLASNSLQAQLPAAILSRFEVASWTCLGDRVAEKVQGFLIRLRAETGEYAGAFLLLADGITRDGGWGDYLESTLEQPLDFVVVPGGLVAGAQNESGRWLLDNASAGDAADIWPALTGRAAEIRSAAQ